MLRHLVTKFFEQSIEALGIAQARDGVQVAAHFEWRPLVRPLLATDDVNEAVRLDAYTEALYRLDS